MSDNNNAALALFAECESLFQDLSPTDESAISGGRWKKHKKNKGNKRRQRRACGRRRVVKIKDPIVIGHPVTIPPDFPVLPEPT